MRMYLIFPSLKKIELNYYLNPACKILKCIRDNEYDITVDITIPYYSYHNWMLDINKYGTYEDCWSNYINKSNNDLHFIAYQSYDSKAYNYLSFNSAIIDFLSMDWAINTKSVFILNKNKLF